MTNEMIAMIVQEAFRTFVDTEKPWASLNESEREERINRVDRHLERLARGEAVPYDGESASGVEQHILASVVNQVLSGRSKTEAA